VSTIDTWIEEEEERKGKMRAAEFEKEWQKAA